MEPLTIIFAVLTAVAAVGIVAVLWLDKKSEQVDKKSEQETTR